MRTERSFLFAVVIGSLVFTAHARHVEAQQDTTTYIASTQADPYARYSTPGQCEQAGIRLASLYWRDKRPDTVVYAPATDSVPASAVAGVRACLSRFSVESVPEHELLNLAQAYLRAQQDDRAELALERLLSSPSQRNPAQRGWTLALIVQSLFDANPSRVDLAQKYLAQLDALGDTVSTWRMFAHQAASGYAMSVHDLQTAEAEARAALQASATMNKADRLDFTEAILNVYESLAEPVAHTTGSNTHALAIFDTAGTDLFPLRGPGTWVGAIPPSRGIGFQVPVRDGTIRLSSTHAKPNDPIDPGAVALTRLKSIWRTKRNPFTLFGEQAASLHIDRWFEPTGDSTSSESRPRPGRVSLVVFVNPNCQPRRCFPTYASIRRLESQFTPQGVDVILVSQVAGWFRNQLVEADEEATLTARYYQDFLEIPATVGVEFRQMRKRARDGRVMRPTTENLKNYVRNRIAVLVTKDGTIGVSSELLPRREMTWRAVLKEALSE